MRIALLSFGLVALFGGDKLAAAAVQPKTRLVNPVVGWYGDLTTTFPEVPSSVIDRAATWERFWKYGGLPGPCPQVNFSTHVVVYTTHTGWSRVLAGWLVVDENGTAKSDWFSQPERIAGSYGILVFPRAGLRSVNGRLIRGDL